MKVEKTSLKLFLTNGVTLTVNDDEEIKVGESKVDLDWLIDFIGNCIDEKETIVFNVKINHKYKDDNNKEYSQEIKHYYNIPYEKISWYMLEEV